MTEFITKYYVPIAIIFTIIIFALSVYLGILGKKLFEQKVKRQRMIESQAQESVNEKERENFLRESIDIICKSTLQGQCDLSESCVRLKKLLINFPRLEKMQELSAIQEMYGEIEKFPYLEERKKLTKQERYTQDKERFMIEDRYREKFHSSLETLINEINP